jgi:hypothetical protein
MTAKQAAEQLRNQSSHSNEEESNMKKPIRAVLFVSALIVAGAVAAQGMLLDFAAEKVIQKYSTSTCEQLWAQKKEPKTEKETMAINFLRNDKQARVAFIDKIAAPVANKMFECGMIP